MFGNDIYLLLMIKIYFSYNLFIILIKIPNDWCLISSIEDGSEPIGSTDSDRITLGFRNRTQ